MKRVRLRIETGSLIHFQHPHKLGYLPLGLSLGLVVTSAFLASTLSLVQIWTLAGLLGLVGFLYWAFRREVQFFPNTQSYVVREGFWPLVKTHEGSYEELIGVVLTRSRHRWICSFALTSIKNPIPYHVSKSERESREHFVRFALHLRTKAFDQTDPEAITEFHWNQLEDVTNEGFEITQNLPDVNFEDPPKGISVEHGRKGFRFALPSKGHRLSYTAQFLFGLTVSSSMVCSLLYFQHEVIDIFLLPILSVVILGLVLMNFGSVGLFGRERIMFYQNAIHTDFAFCGIPFHTSTVPESKVEHIIIRAHTRGLPSEKESPDGESKATFELAIEADFQRVRFGRGHSKETLEWVRSALIHNLHQNEKVA